MPGGFGRVSRMQRNRAHIASPCVQAPLTRKTVRQLTCNCFFARRWTPCYLERCRLDCGLENRLLFLMYLSLMARRLSWAITCSKLHERDHLCSGSKCAVLVIVLHRTGRLNTFEAKTNIHRKSSGLCRGDKYRSSSYCEPCVFCAGFDHSAYNSDFAPYENPLSKQDNRLFVSKAKP
jgi:hypothetical protein